MSITRNKFTLYSNSRGLSYNYSDGTFTANTDKRSGAINIRKLRDLLPDANLYDFETSIESVNFDGYSYVTQARIVYQSDDLFTVVDLNEAPCFAPECIRAKDLLGRVIWALNEKAYS